MAATATYSATVDVSSDDAAYSTVDGCTSIDFEEMVEMLETTNFDSSGVKTFIPGLSDANVSIEYNWNDTDTGQDLIRSSKAGRTLIYIKYLPDGTNGWKVPAYVESISHSATVDGIATSSVTFRPTGAVSEV